MIVPYILYPNGVIIRLNNIKSISHIKIFLNELSKARVIKFNLGIILKAYQIFPDINKIVNSSITIML